MLGYLSRSLPVALRARAGRDGRRVSRLPRRVRLSEIDLNGHMNQAAYAQVFELGRMDLVLRSGAWPHFKAERVAPVVAEQRIVYRRELRPSQRYLVDTRAVGIEGRLLVFESHLLVGDRVHAACDVKLLFVGAEGVLSAERTTALCEGYVTEPLSVRDWRVAPAE